MTGLPSEFQEGRIRAYNLASTLNHRPTYKALQNNEAQALSSPTRAERTVLLGQNALDAATIDLWFSTQAPFLTPLYHLRRASDAADMAVRHFHQAMPREIGETYNTTRLAWAEAISLSGIVTILHALRNDSGAFLLPIEKAQHFLQQVDTFDLPITQTLRAQIDAIILGRTNHMGEGYMSRVATVLLKNIAKNS